MCTYTLVDYVHFHHDWTSIGMMQLNYIIKLENGTIKEIRIHH